MQTISGPSGVSGVQGKLAFVRCGKGMKKWLLLRASVPPVGTGRSKEVCSNDDWRGSTIPSSSPNMTCVIQGSHDIYISTVVREIERDAADWSVLSFVSFALSTDDIQPRTNRQIRGHYG